MLHMRVISPYSRYSTSQPHSIRWIWISFLQRQRHLFGINSTVLSWFESYVACRTKAARLCGTTTSRHPLVCGVPQGSVLETLLFFCYTQLISVSLLQVMHYFLIATPTTLIPTCKRPSECAALTGQILSCIDAVTDWMTIYKPRHNPSKFEFLWCATLRRYHHWWCCSTRLALCSFSVFFQIKYEY